MSRAAPPTIALDFRTLDHLHIGNGQFRYCVDLITGLAALQADARFLVIGSRAEPPDLIRHVFQDPRWRYRRLRPWTFRGADYLVHARYARLCGWERVDLLHSLHTFLPAFSPARSVVTLYDLMNELFEEYANVRASRPFRLFKHLVRAKQPLVIAISESTADDLHRLWEVPRSRIRVVHLAGPPTRGDAPASGAPAGPPVILSPFNLEPRKNLTALLRAVSDLRRVDPSLRLVLFGRAAVTPEREAEFNGLIDSLDLTDAIELTGWISDDARSALFRHATLFVFPSLYEGFGLPVLEAMAEGCCVVARDRSSMREILADTGVQVDTANVAALTDAIRQLLGDPARRDALGRAARARARQFTVEAMAAGTFDVYLEALRGS